MTYARYDISLSLGFGRPYVKTSAHADCRQYLAVARSISGLRAARFKPSAHQDTLQPTAAACAQVSAILPDLNPRLDEWQRRWTWGGSYDAIILGTYTKLATIYGEHVRLCWRFNKRGTDMAWYMHQLNRARPKYAGT
ncbi:hypothetical protein B0T10DRAFT_465073 [Thelonectria olida]|uniref:Uncharacterized protein n=1 Tax=Thelonectria olida TaxID=1576542 RepID=A0A9P8VW03_9HYPO|nr:hypothetical protein B0T10DRAFT_465073 [Thelonectria olida]